MRKSSSHYLHGEVVVLNSSSMWDELSDLVARLLTRFPVISISGSLLLVVLLSSGLYNVSFEHDIRRSFSPKDSKTALEEQTFLQFYNLSVYPQRAFLIFRALDGGDLLRQDCINDMLKFDRMLMNVTSKVGDDGLMTCDPMCRLNAPFQALLKQIEAPNSNSEMTFPVSRIEMTPIFFGMHLHATPINESVDPSLLNLNSPFYNQSLFIDRIVLWYFSRSDTQKRAEEYREITMELFEISKNKNYSDSIEFTIFGDEIANGEMVRGAIEATYLMTIGFVLLLIFVVFIVWNQSPKKMVPLLVTATIVTPFLATLAAFGVLAYLKYPIYSMQCVTPFLVLGIGVDDAFILMHRWRALSQLRDPAQRLRRVIVDVGPSITITSLTNIVAFGAGFFTPTPQMSLFCLLTSVALLLDYMFTYTVLAPVVFLCIEDEQYSAVNEAKKPQTLMMKYSHLLTTLRGRLLCLGFLVVLYAFSGIGVLSMKSSFQPAKGFPGDSPLMQALHEIQPVFDTYFPVNIYVNHPPVISNATDYGTFNQMVSELERIPGAYDRNRTLLFLTAYEEFDKRISSWAASIFLVDQEYKPSLHNLDFWLKQMHYPRNVHYSRGTNKSDEGHLESFSFALLGKGMAEWATRAEFVASIRSTLAKYPQYNATLFDADSAVLSLLLTVGHDLLGSIGVTVACMAIVCLLFVSNRLGVVIITTTIGSICFCLVGCLGWWGADLDPVTQVDVLLATGFSVDYTAHVAYKYYRSTGTPIQRIYVSLDEMAAPMVQAGASTFLCMLPLILVPTYAIVAFAKTIFLVVAIGLIHGLFVLPVLVTTFSPTSPPFQEKTPPGTRVTLIEDEKEQLDLTSNS